MPATTSLALATRRFGLAIALCLLAANVSIAENMTNAQRRAAEEFLNSVAGGGAAGAAYAIHPAELEELRARLLTQMREEAKAGDSTIRGRLFGLGMPLADIERMTPINFYTTLARRLSLSGRPYKNVREVSAIPGPDGTVYAVVRGVQPKDRGDVEVVELVKIRPYGKDWKATIPDELEAQIADLIEGRRMPRRVARSQNEGGASAPAGGAASTSGGATKEAVPVPREITELLSNAEKSLTEGKCEEYYKEWMSRNFRRVTSKKALEALIGTCQRNASTREMLLSTLRIVRGLEPRFEYQGERAVYDLTGQGLPFDRFVLERVDKRWYIAE